MRCLYLAAALGLSACASAGPSSSVTVDDLYAARDQLDQRIDAATMRYIELRAACPTGDPCEGAVLQAQEYGLELIERRSDVSQQIQRASASRSATSEALLAVGQSYLQQAQPRRPVVCHTSNTTNPTTVCQ